MKKEAAKDLVQEDTIRLVMNHEGDKISSCRAEKFSSTISQQLTATMNCIRSPSTCANMNQVISRNPQEASHRATTSPLDRMWNCARVNERVTRQSNAKTPGDHIVNRFMKRSTASYITEGIFKPTLICLLITMTLTASSFYVAHASESANLPGSDVSKASYGNDKPNLSERVDTLSSKSEGHSASAASSSEKSIVASLSSAVATAAAAAAVAAAQNTLSSNDARSLASGSHHRHHAQAQRSPGLNLAIKLVDTIPEVPYNILHNMKKLDHAAPFYNVPNKLSGSTTKESSQNFLSTALASGNLGGAAEQLSAIFRSPLWKRISDGYGEFASEFRSRFRPPGAAPMKGPTSSTSKLLRDISVPALLMLLASSVSGGDWRPVRTRRKSFAPVDIPAALPSGLASSPALLLASNLKDTQYNQPDLRQQMRPNMDPLLSGPPAGEPWIDQAAMNRLQPSQQAEAGQIVRMNEANLQALNMDGGGGIANTWQAGGALMSNAGQEQNQQYSSYVPAMSSSSGAFAQPQAALKRSDEIIATDSRRPSGRSADYSPGQQRASLFSSLTSDLALGQGKLMSKLFNANVASDGNAYRMLSLADGMKRAAPIKRDQLTDKQRYSLIEPTSGHSISEGGANEHSSKPSLLSAMAHAVTSVIKAHPSGESGLSSTAAAGQQSNKPAGFFSRANLQHLIGDKTINHDDTFLRRQPQQATNVAAEQRDLTKLLPESWREVVKRTMTTVQQQANVQWKSIEGQLTNWVQDKLKTVAAGAPGSASASSSSSSASSGSSAAPAPMANMLASMSSTALNILGLHKNTNSSTHSHSSADHSAASSTAKVDNSPTPVGGNEANSANQRGKLEKRPSASQQPAKGALAGVASALVKSLTNRQSSSTTTPSSPLSPPPKPSATVSTPTITNNHDATPHVQSPKADNSPAAAASSSSATSSVASQYPTLGGTQSAEPQSSVKESSNSASAAAAASSQVNVHNAND